MVELKNDAAMHMLVFARLLTSCEDDYDVYYVDSSKLAVCHNRRISSHKVFKGLAQRGKTSVGWFYGFKVHLLINTQGELIDFSLTSGNVSDCNSDILMKILKKAKGKVFGDRGYQINKELRKKLFDLGVQLFAKPKKNMKKPLLSRTDRFFAANRGLAESVLNVLKNSLGLEHSRHRSLKGFLSHVAATLAAYFFRRLKPRIGDIPQPNLVAIPITF